MKQNKFNRREWSKLMLTGTFGALMPSFITSCNQPDSSKSAQDIYKFILGIQTYSMRDRSREDAIQLMKELGITSAEVWAGHIEPREYQLTRFDTPDEVKVKLDAVKKWRQEVDMADFKTMSKQFADAGITVQAYSYNMNDNTSDHDVEQAFKIAEILGTDTMTTSATITSMKRIDSYAQKYKIKVGMHNHSNVNRPNDFSTPETFEKAMEGCSDYTRINLDIGHFVAANLDPLDFLNKNHEKIVCLHVKDRKKEQGPNVPFGEGDTPIKEVLELVRNNQWNIPANIEFEYEGDTKTEIAKCMQYCHNIIDGK